ncbi:zinc finger protein 184-like isoform X2 [Tiliqua scincoides]|uniref:zinc finger protein 184-like isoform X2 n=1 Tax=Tiliqua scincoides TaxID=71010 RepID=UPI0034623BA4
MEENYEAVSSAAPWFSNNDLLQPKASGLAKFDVRTLASTRLETTHPFSTCTFSHPDTIKVDIKTEQVCQQEDLPKEESEILSWQIKQEEDNKSWYQLGMPPGSHLQEGGEKSAKLESTLEENCDPQICIRIKKEKNDHTYASPRQTHKCTSKLAACQKTHTRARSSYNWPEREQSSHPSPNVMGHPKNLTKLEPGCCQEEWITSPKQADHSSKWDAHCSPAGPHELVSKDMEVTLQQEVQAEEGCETSGGVSKGNIIQKSEHRGNAEGEHETEKEPRGKHPREEEKNLLRDGERFPRCGTAVSGTDTEPEDAPRICVRCGKHFGSHALLITHLTGRKRSFACPLCGKGFDFYASCAGHLKGIHNDFDLRPKCLNAISNCSVCPSHEKTDSDKLHCQKKIHCLECGQHFDHKVDFAAHQNEHQKGLVCTDCGRTFQLRSSLAKHRVHCKAMHQRLWARQKTLP